MLHQITYISTARPGLSLSDVEAILARSRRNNRQTGITGLLIFDKVRFLQVIEGRLPDIEATFLRIAVDPRHRAVVRLSQRQIDAREFGQWAMASHVVDEAGSAADLVGQVDALTETLPDPNLRATLRSFARIRGAA
ncbi:BLUF domain-containing protein [Sphingomonas crocodyli]|uniref:BLUF domain-containing protein n=1 Tax=Sphingomonas crocodyli TaxID=1979270 RepID=A0A437LYG1_9SPHN|nr:BLUF domain-containing protein [Sphingomonas crocodyli]RVT90386.1 BLUF domain-containing protein [Sphingomonas crocodyli]